jgi:hypothetical protein
MEQSQPVEEFWSLLDAFGITYVKEHWSFTRRLKPNGSTAANNIQYISGKNQLNGFPDFDDHRVFNCPDKLKIALLASRDEEKEERPHKAPKVEKSEEAARSSVRNQMQQADENPPHRPPVHTFRPLVRALLHAGEPAPSSDAAAASPNEREALEVTRSVIESAKDMRLHLDAVLKKNVGLMMEISELRSKKERADREASAKLRNTVKLACMALVVTAEGQASASSPKRTVNDIVRMTDMLLDGKIRKIYETGCHKPAANLVEDLQNMGILLKKEDGDMMASDCMWTKELNAAGMFEVTDLSVWGPTDYLKETEEVVVTQKVA